MRKKPRMQAVPERPEIKAAESSSQTKALQERADYYEWLRTLPANGIQESANKQAEEYMTAMESIAEADRTKHHEQ